MEQLIAQLLALFTPIIADIIRKHRERTGQDPTDEQIKAEFFANVDTYLGEGSAWKAAHPPQQ